MKRYLALAALIVATIGLVVVLATPNNSSNELAAETTVTTTTDPGPTQAEIDQWNAAIWRDAVDRNTWNEAAWIHRTNERIWVDKTNERLAAEQAERQRQADAAANRRSSTPAPAPSSDQVSARPGICGGDLPPCHIVNRESGFNPTAQNPTSSASGLYQFIDSTWRSCPYSGGYAKASHAPVSVQAQCARWLWAGGAGAGHW